MFVSFVGFGILVSLAFIGLGRAQLCEVQQDGAEGE
jgi:hypothetical protein